MFNTLKSKLIASTVLFILTLLLVIGGTVWYEFKVSNINKLSQAVYQTNFLVLETDKTQRDFFSYELINPSFYTSEGKSKFIDKHNRQITQLRNQIHYLQNSKFVKSRPNLKINLDSLLHYNIAYQNAFDSLVQLTYRKGFKDYGVVGKMREQIHNIEQAQNPPIPLDKILSVRRHEKDFIIRKDTKYIREAKKELYNLFEGIKKRTRDPKKRTQYLEWVTLYKKYFLEMTVLERKIGYTNINGLKGALNAHSTSITNILDDLKNQFETEKEAFNASLRLRLITFILISICINLVLAILIIKKLGDPLSKLSESIRTIVKQKFRGKNEVYVIEDKDEIGMLSKDVSFLVDNITDYMRIVEEKNLELSSQNSELAQQQEKILAKNKIIDERNTKIMDSIAYAKRIQTAMLPKEDYLNTCFDKAFVLFRPKDIVSGDLFFLHQSEQQTTVAAIDCTGHGVPGALMSMIAFNALSNIFQAHRNILPDQILILLHEAVVKTLKQDENNNQDGMDVSICVYEHSSKRLTYAGAKGQGVYIQNGIVNPLKGDKLPVAGMVSRKRAFTLQTIELSSPTTVYLFSDGYQDQFGGAKSRKFMRKKLCNLLEEIHLLQADKQKEILSQNFDQWKGDEQQTDDVLLIGFEINV